MSRIAYIEKRFTAVHTHIVRVANRLCREFQADGLDLTLRQLYYQYVAHDLFPDDWTWTWTGAKWVKDADGTKNAEPNYKRLGTIINDARLAGEIDWDYIVDRTREPDGPGTERSPHWASPAEIMRGAAHGYAIDKWLEQDYYVEAWVEKEAMAGILESACPELDVSFFCCRGYSSQSAMWGAAQRIGARIDDGRKARVIYLGDHDPSGIDMTRDVADRLATFIAVDRFSSPPCPSPAELPGYVSLYHEDVGDQLQVDRIALNMDQVQRYNPPPNPAKMGDSRAGDYVSRFGYESWELDALSPTILRALIRDAVEAYRNDELWDGAVEREEEERKDLTAAASRWPEVSTFLNGGAS